MKFKFLFLFALILLTPLISANTFGYNYLDNQVTGNITNIYENNTYINQTLELNTTQFESGEPATINTSWLNLFIEAVSKWGNFVPYENATGDVDLGANNITANNLNGTNTGDQELPIEEFTNYETTIETSYPPEHSGTYVKATTRLSGTYEPYFATDPSLPLIGAYSSNSWVSTSGGATNQRFHVDLGSAKILKSFKYNNFHHSGTITEAGVKSFTLWGSNDVDAFNELTYGTDTGWTQITTNTSEFLEHTATNTEDEQTITATNTIHYRYYAFKFADNHGNTNVMGLRHIELVAENVLITLIGAEFEDYVNHNYLNINYIPYTGANTDVDLGSNDFTTTGRGTFGTTTGASGTYSFAAGKDVKASGDKGAVAIGDGATASGDISTAIGWDVTASGNNAYALGQKFTNSVTQSFAVGFNQKDFYVKQNEIGIPQDNSKFLLGAGGDASITYDGTNLLINPREVGSGNTIFTGGVVELYDTADRTTNYEKLSIFNSINTYKINSLFGGTATTQALEIGVGATADSSANRRYRIQSATPMHSYLIGGTGLNGPIVIMGEATLGDNTFRFVSSNGRQIPLKIAPQIDQSGTASYTGLEIDIDEDTTGSGTNYLIDAKINGTSKFSVGTGGDTKIISDLAKLYFGAGDDASITYDGSDMVFTQEVGAGDFVFNDGNVVVGTHDGTNKFYINRYSSAVPYAYFSAGRDDEDTYVGFVLQGRNNDGNPITLLRAHGDTQDIDIANGNLNIPNDNAKLYFGAGDDYSQYFDGTNQNFELTSGGFVFKNTAGFNRAFKIGPQTLTEGDGAYIEFTSSSVDGYGPQIGGLRSGAGGAGDLVFRTGTNAQAERLRITDTGDIKIPADNAKLLFGEGDDASITYKGTNMVINPKEVGSGILKILGDLFVNEDLFVNGDTYLNNTEITGNLNQTNGNATINNIYGGMWYTNYTATELNFAVDGTFYQLYFTNATHLNGFGVEGLGAGLASNLTTQYAGVYQVNYMAAGDGQNNHIYHTSVFINGVNQMNCDTIHKMASGGDILTQTGVCLIDLEVGDKVSLRTADVGSTGTGNYYGANIDLVRVGN